MTVRKGQKARPTAQHKDKTKYDRNPHSPEYREWHEQAAKELDKIRRQVK